MLILRIIPCDRLAISLEAIPSFGHYDMSAGILVHLEDILSCLYTVPTGSCNSLLSMECNMHHRARLCACASYDAEGLSRPVLHVFCRDIRARAIPATDSAKSLDRTPRVRTISQRIFIGCAVLCTSATALGISNKFMRK
jgi:hypothetical protein